jgi:omega-6 fatty acid desaturase (delta-12 desaturase)
VDWLDSLKAFEGGDDRKAVVQFILTLSLYLGTLYGMFWMVLSGFSYWAVLLLSLPAGGLHMKLFIIMHDCGHNSFMKSARASTFVGRICAVLTFTPYYDWRRAHAIHHATVSNLDKRGTGDVWTMTTEEYLSCRRWKRLLYQMYRNPIFLFVIGPLLLFLVVFRFPRKNHNRRSIRSVVSTNVALAVLITGVWLTVGIIPYMLVMLPVLIVAGTTGVWLFFIQHQYPDVYWDRSVSWDSVRAALEGSSFYRLPAVLRWFSGNIGYHHIHHLNPRIPNYRLRRCYQEVPEVQVVEPITIRTSLRSLFLQVWDEQTRKLMNIRTILERRRARA